MTRPDAFPSLNFYCGLCSHKAVVLLQKSWYIVCVLVCDFVLDLPVCKPLFLCSIEASKLYFLMLSTNGKGTGVQIIKIAKQNGNLLETLKGRGTIHVANSELNSGDKLNSS